MVSNNNTNPPKLGKKRGRKQSVKFPSMRAHAYSDDALLYAKENYLKGVAMSTIAKEINIRYATKCNAALVKQWVVKYKWDEERLKILTTMENDVVVKVKDELAERAAEQKIMYKTLADEGFQHLKDGAVLPDKMTDVIDMIDKGVRGERAIDSGIISMKFVMTLMDIVKEEVHDDEILRKIANRLQRESSNILSI